MHYLTNPQEIREAIARYSQQSTLWLDTEIADYKTKFPRLSLIQILDNSTDIQGNHVTILDVLDRPELADEFIAEIMVNGKIEKVFHNAKYDLKFLGQKRAQNVTCTLEMVKKIPYYLVPLNNQKLKTLAEKLCNFPPIDKTEQQGNWGQRPLNTSQLEYAKMDPVYLAHVHHRLLQFSQLVNIDPAQDDLDALLLRYRQIEHSWKQLDTEVNHLKKRLKAAMEAQNISERQGMKLSSRQQKTLKVSFSDLAQLTQNLGIELDLSLTLNKAQQKELGDLLQELPVEEKISHVSYFKIQEQTEEDLPF